jgi:deoxyadenosine/deoxycytidine kinase
MSIIISLQGGMAVGKSTLAYRLQRNLHDTKVILEYPKKRPAGLDMFKENDFYQIQRYFIQLEIERYRNLPPGNVIIDLGPEEIEFYTLFFPQSIGQDWKVAEALHNELSALRECRLDGIFYLDASPKILSSRKEGDPERKRGFFDNYLKYLHPFKKPWFAKLKNTTFIDVDQLTPEELEQWTLDWLKRQWNIE